ncbi:MAG TPA: hypothetical protein PLA62_10070 [Clostridia bacterium]|nr:hypothetical protein [Clostridia bacterium]
MAVTSISPGIRMPLQSRLISGIGGQTMQPHYLSVPEMLFLKVCPLARRIREQNIFYTIGCSLAENAKKWRAIWL